MLCLIFNEDKLQGVDINYYVTCKEVLYFNFAGLIEANLRKISKVLMDNWSCSTSKTKKTPISQTTSLGNTQTITDETLKSVVDTVNFMSSQFDDLIIN